MLKMIDHSGNEFRLILPTMSSVLNPEVITLRNILPNYYHDPKMHLHIFFL